jgi:hypothetical protein
MTGVGKSVLGEDQAPAAIETEEQRIAREKREAKESFLILSKDESAMEMNKREFDEFFTKTSRIVERALD